MPDLRYSPISRLEETLIHPLLEDEAKAWMADLDWDYSPVRRILLSFIRQRLLPGYAAVAGGAAVGYTYFLVNRSKAIIGALYTRPDAPSRDAAGELLSLAISCLKDMPAVRRVEAQIMPFHRQELTPEFTRHGFRFTPRHYLELDLSLHRKRAEPPDAARCIPWEPALLPPLASMTAVSYENQADAVICEDYRSPAGCEGYLRSLVENPGCGIFMPEASFVALDREGAPCGFVLCCRISPGAAIIPQIAVHPRSQGQRLGNMLMNRALVQLKSLGFRTVSLTVTEENVRAFGWYGRLGFKTRKQFGAYVWLRDS